MCDYGSWLFFIWPFSLSFLFFLLSYSKFLNNYFILCWFKYIFLRGWLWWSCSSSWPTTVPRRRWTFTPHPSPCASCSRLCSTTLPSSARLSIVSPSPLFPCIELCLLNALFHSTVFSLSFLNDSLCGIDCSGLYVGEESCVFFSSRSPFSKGTFAILLNAPLLSYFFVVSIPIHCFVVAEPWNPRLTAICSTATLRWPTSSISTSVFSLAPFLFLFLCAWARGIK